MNNTMIEAGELPRKIALYLEPPQPDKDWLSSVIRRTVLGEKHYQDDDLKSNADVDLLIRIGSAAQITFLDLMNGDCGHDCFDSYMRVFNESPLKPDWTLVPKFNNYEKEAEIRRHRIRMDHFGLIEESARRGEIKLLTRNRTPTFRIDPEVLISLSDAHKYLDSIGLPVDLLEIKTQQVSTERDKIKKRVGRPRKTDRIEHHLDEITRNAREAASTMRSPTCALVVKRLMTSEEWKDRFSRRDWDKTIETGMWKK